MKPTPELIAEAQRVVPDLDEVRERLDSSRRRCSRALHRPSRGRREPRGERRAARRRRDRARPAGAHRRRAHRRRSATRDRQDPARRNRRAARSRGSRRTEAIILLFGRPALLIQEGKFFPPPELWAKLENSRDAIQTAIQSVGRIEVKGHPAMDWIGTGWLVAPDVVITNRHVAKEFSRQSGRSWVFEPGMKGRIDFHEEFGAAPPRSSR